MNTSHNKRDPLKKALGSCYYKRRPWAMVIWTLKVTMILFIIRGLKHPRCTNYISSREPVSSKREGLRHSSLPLLSYNHLLSQGRKGQRMEGRKLPHTQVFHLGLKRIMQINRNETKVWEGEFAVFLVTVLFITYIKKSSRVITEEKMDYEP